MFKQKWFFVGILKVNDEKSRIRIQDPDPLVRGMDPRIRIHSKMSWIRKTATNIYDEFPVYRAVPRKLYTVDQRRLKDIHVDNKPLRRHYLSVICSSNPHTCESTAWYSNMVAVVYI